MLCWQPLGWGWSNSSPTSSMKELTTQLVSGQSEDCVQYLSGEGAAKMMKRWCLLRMRSLLLAAAAVLRTCFHIVSLIILENKDFKQPIGRWQKKLRYFLHHPIKTYFL